MTARAQAKGQPADKPPRPLPLRHQKKNPPSPITVSKMEARTIPYKATAATIILKKRKGMNRTCAGLFYTAYTRSDV